MAIWEISFDPDTFQRLALRDPVHDVARLVSNNWFQGASIGAAWTPIAVELSPDGLPGDFPSLGGTPLVFSERAVRILSPLMRDCVELLSLTGTAEPLYVVNVTKVLNCLDHTRSQFKRFSDGQRIMRIEKYVFREPCIHQAHIFKIPEQIRNRHYVSTSFKDTVEGNGLRGMVFHQIA